jgi:hypothetical protein
MAPLFYITSSGETHAMLGSRCSSTVLITS